MNFTFGIITSEENNESINNIIDSIESQNIPYYEIIIIGKFTTNRKNTTVIEFDENIKKGWITKKKNIITQQAKYENIVYLHDYIYFDSKWYEGQLKAGDNYYIRIDKIINKDGSRAGDWILDMWGNKQIYDLVSSTHSCLLPYNITNLSKFMYISGAYWVAKKQVMLKFPLDENKVWGESEDLDWSRKVRKEYNFDINTNSSVHLMKQKGMPYIEPNNELLLKILDINKQFEEPEMVLLFNVFVTNKSSTKGHWEKAGITYDRGNLNKPNRLEILKYSLASYAIAYPWKRVILNLEIDPEYLPGKQDELETYVHQIFKDVDLIYSNKRNLHQQDWSNTYDLINGSLIFYQCNHDHIFIDSSISYLKELTLLRKKYRENLTISTSHFPEAIRTAKCGYIDHHELTPQSFPTDYQVHNNYLSKTGQCMDSLIIITKEIYENWFLEGDWGRINVPLELFPSGKMELTRSEGIGVIGLAGIKEIIHSPLIKQTLITPYKELFRHFDGYWHQKISNNQCPAIDIPPGFFENDIKIRYGYDDYKEGWVNINPKNEYYYAYDKSGTDYKFTLKDLPLVWKGRISEIDSNPNIDEEEMLQYRLKSVLEMVYTNPKYDPYIDKEVEEKIINAYIKDYPEYEY